MVRNRLDMPWHFVLPFFAMVAVSDPPGAPVNGMFVHLASGRAVALVCCETKMSQLLLAKYVRHGGVRRFLLWVFQQ